MVTRLKKQERYFKIIILLVWIVGFYLLINHSLHLERIGQAIIILICVSWYLFVQTWHHEILDVLEKKCDPEEFFLIHEYYGNVTLREKTKTRHNYEMIRAKLESGDISEAQHYLAEFQKGKLNHSKIIHYHILKCAIAVAEQNFNEIDLELQELQSFTGLTSEHKKRILFLNAALAGIRENPTDQLQFLAELQKYPLTVKDKVAWNFLLYKSYYALNDPRAKECYDYVISHGNKLIYRKQFASIVR